jgi:hypothetical protein
MPRGTSRDRIKQICLAFPEATASERQHIKFEVRGKTFGYYLEDHHGDGRLAFACKAPAGMQASLIASYPERFFLPAYLGARGWVAVALDSRHIDWDEVSALAAESYRLTAPKRLVAQLPQGSSATRARGPTSLHSLET